MSLRKESKMTGKAKGFKDDGNKPRYDLIPVLALEELAKVLTLGAESHNEDYDDENWRRVEHSNRRFYSAAQRHIAEVRKGNSWDTGDKGTNCHHYACAISSLMFLLQKELEEHALSLKEVEFNEAIEKEYYSGFGNVKPEKTPTEVEYGGYKYVAQPEDKSGTCDNCAFSGFRDKCENSWDTLDCVDAGIIWIKKETN